MNIEQFKEKYKQFKDIDEIITIGKQPPKRNIAEQHNRKASFYTRKIYDSVMGNISPGKF